MRRLPLALLSCATLLLAAGAVAAANTAAPAARQVLYGDLHIHTALSADAFSAVQAFVTVSSTVRMVRETPRLPPAFVRDAIIELCAQYRSLPALARAIG